MTSFELTIFIGVIGLIALGFFVYTISNIQDQQDEQTGKVEKKPLSKASTEPQASQDKPKNVFTDDKPAPPRPDMNTLRDMTPSELSECNSGNKVYVSICDLVYDVSSSDAYRPGSSYSVFAGKDASVALAKMNFNPENFTKRWD